MIHQYKPDWDITKKRLIEWWNHEYTGRALVGVTGTRKLKEYPVFPEPKTSDEKWFDHKYLTDVMEYEFQTTYYGGESIPVWNVGYPGWAQPSAYIGDGSHIQMNMQTANRDHIYKRGMLSDYGIEKFTINKNNPNYIRAEQMQKFVIKQAKGKAIPTNCTFVGSGDDFTDLRGATELIYDLFDCPEMVKKYDMHMVRQGVENCHRLFDLLDARENGATTWYKLWAPGTNNALYCDFSYNLSTSLFVEFFFEQLQFVANSFDYNIYHLDGAASLIHLGALLEIKNVHAFEVVPGVYPISPLHYIKELRQIQEAGRSLYITIKPDEILTALDNLSAKGLYLHTYVSTQEEAEAIVKIVEQESKII